MAPECASIERKEKKMSEMKCKRCKGAGVVYDSKKNAGVTCPSCGGSGKAKDTVRH